MPYKALEGREIELAVGPVGAQKDTNALMGSLMANCQVL